MKNFHVPLPEDLYKKLRRESKRRNRPATEIVRQIIEAWLREREREILYEEIASYAKQEAGTKNDLDRDLEEASLEHISKEN